MSGTTVDFNTVIFPDALASEVANKWLEWSQARIKWVEERKELRNYLYATSTSTTANAVLPWSNTTTTPKLTQISDNLHANYMATLFPATKWLRWEALDDNSGVALKKAVIQSYIDNKLRQGNFVSTASQFVRDYINDGNCFGLVTFQKEYRKNESGEDVISYVGPKAIRISPYDICFDPTASSFQDAPKIIRSIITLGEVQKLIDNGSSEYQKVFDKMLAARGAVKSGGDYEKAEGYIADGFGSISQYYSSGSVEVLTFYGDIYDTDVGKVHYGRIITVVDRAYVLDNVEDPSWDGKAKIFHAGWRERPDNLYAMGPLDNLVGMQYRIDHLENLKADVFDQIAYPMMKIKGQVEEFTFQPAEKIYIGEEGDVAYLVPDATALQADFQIKALEDKMEELAGAPRQAMGIRTPGEKTAFEVQSLQNSASRIFEHKAAHFERTFLEPLMNAMLEESKRNLDIEDTIAIPDEASGATVFKQITKQDITGNGKIIPIGARHFAERARRVQNLTQLWQVKAQDPSVGAHLSGKEFARILSEELGEPRLFGDNIAISEQMETQAKAQDAEANNMDQLAIQQEMGV